MMERMWVIPLMIILMINVTLTVVDSQMPFDKKIMGPNDPIYQVPGLDYADGTYTIGDTSVSTDATGDSVISASDADAENVGVNVGETIGFLNTAWDMISNMTYGLIFALEKVGLPTAVLIILAVPISIIYVFGILYLASFLLGALTGKIR